MHFDALLFEGSLDILEQSRINTNNSHGTGVPCLQLLVLNFVEIKPYEMQLKKRRNSCFRVFF